MSTIKFLHCADLHLDSPFHGLKSLPTSIFKAVQASTFVALQTIVKIAIDHRVDFILMAGDLFDGENRSIYAQAKLREQFLRLREKNIQVYISYGNHDHLEGKSAPFLFPDNVHIFPDKVEVIPFIKDKEHVANIYGFSYPSRHHYMNEIERYSKQDEQVPYHIGMLHGNLSGRNDHDPYAPFTLSQLLSKQFQYWALGHIHKREILHEDPYVVYPGNIQGRHKKETGEKGCYLVTLNGAATSLQFFETGNVRWETVSINISSFETMDEIIEAIQQEISEKRNVGNVLLQIVINGQGALHSELVETDAIEDVRQWLNEGEEENSSFVYIYEIKIETELSINKEQLKQIPFFQDFFSIVEENNEWNLSSLYEHHEARKYLQKLSEDEKHEMTKEAENWIVTKLVEEKR